MDKRTFLVRMHRTGTFAKADVDAWEINVTTLEDLMLPADVATLALHVQTPARPQTWFVVHAALDAWVRG